MSRVKRGSSATKKRERLLKQTKGYGWNRKSKERTAREALLKAWTYSHRDRKVKKRDFRRLWQVKINAAARENGTTYGRLIDSLHKKGVELDRKILADLAENEPKVFSEVASFSGASDGATSGEDSRPL
ncbi:MAG: 50S ribosomal protein L20 [Parcubacteria group bacterium GW2011_GWB1_45_7]|uniref:Large ribosomal subunit protein bL20 n=2 Tax=Candidatus Colwelliibacteriota TaxID=1817904 RepID=A0A1G1ZEF0_9BACT|nr:MAG: 50S ribosomal protein L20 [Parcubacteria group bacterium GW2011_GWB1_45_7]OGY57674.1 MAG: 50S ribosomal protein L20 [Candidatus Colwellbacteria bacterium RIFCSPHIGHO2_02_FULL_45_17]OGY60786.1 MAG: 50S ribosomal protein L20 [Candidatus Colwellbacteria bacterium RIFCSPLOWO2_02_FULL_45_11]OGY62197.1 MAG: 50S ribosomal protein L20 [Candidatus Colwellbacteria bacterium RIFCSPLOWO2_12_FULL_46_17]